MGKSGGGSRTVRERHAAVGNAGQDRRANPLRVARAPVGVRQAPKLRVALAQHEREIVGSAREQARVLNAEGKVLVSKAGTAHRINFTEAEIKRMAGATFTHNHHYTTGLTMEDGKFAAYNGLAEMRAVDANHTYSLRPGLHVGWSADYWDKVVQPSWNRNRDAVAEEIRNTAWRTGASPDTLAQQQWHMVWERVAADTGLRYSRTRAPSTDTVSEARYTASGARKRTAAAARQTTKKGQ